jgi:multisubunit Na+/H+ antiporter MnhE subunit
MQASMQLCHFVFWSVPAAAAVDIHIDHGVYYLSAIDCSDRTEGIQKIQYMFTVKK